MKREQILELTILSLSDSWRFATFQPPSRSQLQI